MAVPSLSHTAESTGLVSVVMATYRGERFIGEALESIGNQTYPHWEIVVVEDGSHDGAERIVKDFARRHPTHRVDFTRSDENRGLGHTRNLTFAKARGEFVAILDVDDRWLPGFLAAAVPALQASGKDLAYSSTVMIEDQTDLLLGVWGPTAHELHDFPQSLFGRSFLTPSATLIRRQTLDEVGPWDTFRYAEDYSYWMRCVAAGKQFQHIGGCHCLYRKNHQGAMTQSLSGTLEGVAEVAERFADMPGTRPQTSRKYASITYAVAAYLHSKADPRHDPSADPSRASRLLLKAWRLHPKRIDYLFRGSLHAIAKLFRRNSRPIVVQSPADQSPNRVAA